MPLEIDDIVCFSGERPIEYEPEQPYVHPDTRCCLIDYPSYEIYGDGRIVRVKGTRRGRMGTFHGGNVCGHRKLGLRRRDGKRDIMWHHRIICTAFHGEPPPVYWPVVMHLDGDPTNNNANNLAWGTQSENLRGVR